MTPGADERSPPTDFPRSGFPKVKRTSSGVPIEIMDDRGHSDAGVQVVIGSGPYDYPRTFSHAAAGASLANPGQLQGIGSGDNVPPALPHNDRCRVGDIVIRSICVRRRDFGEASDPLRRGTNRHSVAQVPKGVGPLNPRARPFGRRRAQMGS